MTRFAPLYRIPNALVVAIALGYYVMAFATGVSFETINWNTWLAAAILAWGIFLPALGFGPGGMRLMAAIALWLGWTHAFLNFFIIMTLSLALFGKMLIMLGRINEDEQLPILPFAAIGMAGVTVPWAWLIGAA